MSTLLNSTDGMRLATIYGWSLNAALVRKLSPNSLAEKIMYNVKTHTHRLHFDLWSWPSIAGHLWTHAEDQGLTSLGSKVRLETDRRTDGGDCITWLTNAVGKNQNSTLFTTSNQDNELLRTQSCTLCMIYRRLYSTSELLINVYTHQQLKQPYVSLHLAFGLNARVL